MVYATPVDVRLSEHDQVQPDLLAIRRDRRHIYRGHTVHGAPDIVVEILPPSNPGYDEVEKRRLVDPVERTLTILRPGGDSYEPVAPEGGVLCSTAIVDFTIDPAALFALLAGE
jgi:Uma2 family endonuclease